MSEPRKTTQFLWGGARWEITERRRGRWEEGRNDTHTHTLNQTDCLRLWLLSLHHLSNALVLHHPRLLRVFVCVWQFQNCRDLSRQVKATRGVSRCYEAVAVDQNVSVCAPVYSVRADVCNVYHGGTLFWAHLYRANFISSRTWPAYFSETVWHE